jgi:transposase InsO family protein
MQCNGVWDYLWSDVLQVWGRPRFCYRRIASLLRKELWRASATRIYRLWRREGLKVPQKKRKRRRLGKSENDCHRRRALHKDHVWCWDFVFDYTTAGSTLKWLSIVDVYTRECLTLKVDRSVGRTVRHARRAKAHSQ